MISRQNKSVPVHGNAGFSMIDVLIAIIVLATAMLALAALQGAVTRNSADARARSQIAAFSEGLIEQMRRSGYDTIVTATITPTITTCPDNSSWAKEAYCAQATAGVSNLQAVATVSTYYGPAGTFTTTVPTIVSSTTPQYKQLDVTTTWTDATGQARTLKLDSIISSLTTQGTTPLTTDSSPTTTTMSPTVREINPSATAGVIPIAVGTTGNQSAATNPKPALISLGGNKTAVVGTSYSVLTYAAPDSNNDTVIKQLVDTRVIACSCKYGAGLTSSSSNVNVFAQPFRPTYWNGAQYIPPSQTAAASSNTGEDPNAIQDDFCDICCRDRNDPAATGDDQTLFDPWTSDHRHFYYDSSSTLQPASSGVNGGVYVNACRLIRVGGLYSVATDLQNYFFGLLATATPSPATSAAKSPIPDTTDTSDFGTGGAVAAYQAFVLKYMQSNISTLETGTLPGTIPSVASTATTYGGTPYNLDRPTSIGITYNSTTTDYRYLHARGLYIDYLEPAAVAAINNAIANCSTSTPSDCFLPILPFTTINLTELANWNVTTTSATCPTGSNSISVNNQAIINEAFNVSRGVVNAQSCAKSTDAPIVQAKVGDSNTGVAATGTGFASPIDLTDQANVQSDTQNFTITTSGSSGSGSVSATLTLTPSTVLPQLAKGYQSTYPSISWQLDSVAAPTGSLTACSANVTGNGGNTQLSNYTCPSITTASTPPIAATMTVKLSKYNYAYTQSANNPCFTGHNTTVQYCANYQVDTTNILVNGTAVSGATVAVANDGNVGSTTTTAEMSTITFPSLSLTTTDTISIGFTLQGTTSPTPTCSGGSGHTATYPACN